VVKPTPEDEKKGANKLTLSQLYKKVKNINFAINLILPGLTAAIAAPSLRLALDVRSAYAAGTGVPYSTYIGHAALDQRSDLGGLNLSTVPKVFIETGNMRDAADAALLEDPGFRQRAAQALAAGLQAFLTGH